MFLEIRQTQGYDGGTILTISNGVKFLLPEFEMLFETLALLELRRIFPLCVLFHVASSSNIYVHI